MANDKGTPKMDSVGGQGVFTAPMAIIKIGGVAVGKIKNLQFTENVQRGEVQGIGRLTLSEVPPLSVRCSFTADSFLINFDKLGTVPDPFWPTAATTPEIFANSMILGEVGVSLHVYSKLKGAGYVPPTLGSGPLVTTVDEGLMGIAYECYLDSRTFSIQEQQIAGKNLSGRYLEPLTTHEAPAPVAAGA